MILWYNTHKKGQGALKTQEMYRNCINNHINPALGHKRLKEITATQVQALLNSITSSKSLAHKVRITLNQIFKQAIADRLVNFNPVQACKVIAPDKPKREFLSSLQEKLLEILKAIGYIHSYTPCYIQGCVKERRSPGLTLILKTNNCFKSHWIQNQSQKPDQKQKEVSGKYLCRKNLLNISGVKKKTKSIYVFPGARGLMGLTELNNHWRKAKRRIAKWFEANPDTDIEPFNLTCRLLRHTYCTGLFDAEIDEVSAAEIMGHDVNIMRQIYTHISEKRRKATVKKIEKLYKSKKRSKKRTNVVI